MEQLLKTTIAGHVTVTDKATGEVLLDADNAIHPKNMAIALARGLSNAANFQVYKIKLGNAGTYIDGSAQIHYRLPNTTSDTANLYNATYAEVVDDANVDVGPGNSVTFTTVPSTTNTRVIITAVISSNEAINNATDTGTAGQAWTGSGSSPTSSSFGNQYFFDELGLFTKETAVSDLINNAGGNGELLLTHLIFSPIEHTGNRELTLVYTLTISVS